MLYLIFMSKWAAGHKYFVITLCVHVLRIKLYHGTITQQSSLKNDSIYVSICRITNKYMANMWFTETEKKQLYARLENDEFIPINFNSLHVSVKLAVLHRHKQRRYENRQILVK